MARPPYVPDRGDIVWLQFNPQAGPEQAGHRPALVLSPAAYNRRSGLMLCCPMTSHRKGYPFEVVMADEPEHTSVVLADQVKSLDWKGRRAIKKGTAPLNVVSETLSSSRHSSDTPEAMVPRNGDILLFWGTGTGTAAEGNRWEPGLAPPQTGIDGNRDCDGNRREPGQAPPQTAEPVPCLWV